MKNDRRSYLDDEVKKADKVPGPNTYAIKKNFTEKKVQSLGWKPSKEKPLGIHIEKDTKKPDMLSYDPKKPNEKRVIGAVI